LAGVWRMGIAEQVADKCLYSVGIERYIVIFRADILFDVLMLEIFGDDP